MSVLTDEERIWTDDLVRRLRLIQTDAADHEPDKRRQFIQEALDRNLKEITTPAKRKRLLEALLARFPIAGQIGKTTTPPAPAPSPAPPPPIEETPEQLLERFLAAAGNLAPEKRELYSKRLAEAGFVSVDRDALVLEVSEELRQKLGLPAGEQLRLQRVIDLLILLFEQLQGLDETTRKTMRELNKQSPLINRASFRNAATQFLLSDARGTEVQSVFRLAGLLCTAIQGGGKRFGKEEYIDRLAPAAIEFVVDSEHVGAWFGPNRKERCWAKYQELAQDFATPDLIDRRIKDSLAKFVETEIREMEQKARQRQ